MYIYDPKLSGSRSRSKEQPITSQPPQRNSYYPDRGISGFGRAASSVVDPFPRPIVMSLDMANVTFRNCIEAASRPPDVSRLCGAVVDLTGDPDLPPYAGHNDTDMLYVGSLAKIYPLLAAFELRRRVTRQAKDMIKIGLSTATAGWENNVFA